MYHHQYFTGLDEDYRLKHVAFPPFKWANLLGCGTGFWEFNYAGEARGLFSNSVIKTGVLRVLLVEWLIACLFLVLI